MTQHGRNQTCFGPCRRRRGTDQPTVAADADFVGNGQNFVKVVADEENSDALGSQFANASEQRVPFRRRERGGRFIEKKNPRFALQRADDFQHLLISYGKHPGDSMRRNGHAESAAQFIEPQTHCALGKEAKTRTRLSEEHVGAGRKVRNDGKFLIDGDNARGARYTHVAGLQDLAENLDFSCIHPNSSGQHA